LGENTVGEYDLLLTPSVSTTSSAYFLNWTQIDRSLQDLEIVKGTAPRSALLAKLVNRNQPTKNVSVMALVIDSLQEQKIGLGREWNHSVLPLNHIHVSYSALRAISTTNYPVAPNKGVTVNLTVDFLNLLTVRRGEREREREKERESDEERERDRKKKEIIFLFIHVCFQ